LAPAAYLGNATNPLITFDSKNWRLLFPAAEKVGLYEVDDPKLDKALRAFCENFE